MMDAKTETKPPAAVVVDGLEFPFPDYPAPGTATEVVSFTIYRRFFTEDRMGYGSAISVTVLFIVTLLIVMGLSAARRREAHR